MSELSGENEFRIHTAHIMNANGEISGTLPVPALGSVIATYEDATALAEDQAPDTPNRATQLVKRHRYTIGLLGAGTVEIVLGKLTGIHRLSDGGLNTIYATSFGQALVSGLNFIADFTAERMLRSVHTQNNNNLE